MLKAGFRYGDAAPMAIIELVDRDVNAKKVVKPAATTEDKATEKSADKAPKQEKTTKAPAAKADKDADAAKEKKPATKRRSAAK